MIDADAFLSESLPEEDIRGIVWLDLPRPAIRVLEVLSSRQG